MDQGRSTRRLRLATGATLVLGGRTRVMGVLNVTPDSFSDGGQYFEAGAAVARGEQMAAEGADVIDVGGESTRPGSQRVPAEEQIRRVVPVIRELAKRVSTPISVDTTRAGVAEAALEAGAGMINDVSALRDDEAMSALAARRGAPVVLMHMLGAPATMQDDPRYDDVVGEITAFLRARVAAAEAAGIAKEQIIVDPGLGFGKTAEHNLQILGGLSAIRAVGCPLLIGPSRKRFIGHLLGGGTQERLMGTAATVAWCAAAGVELVRVHDVKEMVQVIRVWGALSGGMVPA